MRKAGLRPSGSSASTSTIPYFKMVHDGWGQKLRAMFDSLEDPQWGDEPTEVPLMTPSARFKPLKKISSPQERLI